MFTLLPNTLFDDGSIECKTLTICTQDGSFYTDFERISTIPAYRCILQALQYAIRNDLKTKGMGHWIDTRSINLYTLEGDRVLEIHWD